MTNKSNADCCAGPGLMPMKQAMALMQQQVKVVAKTEKISVEDALDRVLAEDVYSEINVPPADNSAMDGYAFRAEDKAFSDNLKLIGKSMAGHPFDGQVNQGQCVRIMTGAQVPDGADTVMMQENTHAHGDSIEILTWPAQGNSIRRAGEDVKQGDKVMQKGTRLSPVDLGLIASLGLAQIRVFKKIKVAVMASGDELVRAGGQLPAGGIYESNSLVTLSVLKRLNVETRDMGIVADNMDDTIAAFKEAMSWADVLITSGGVSVGDADYIKDVLEQLGSIGFWKLAIKPGKPFAFGELSNNGSEHCQFFGLPGNPVSATVTLHRLVLPVLKMMQGEVLKESLVFKIPIKQAVKRKAGRLEFQRATLNKNEAGEYEVDLFHSQSSGVLSSMSGSNGYVIIDEDIEQIEAKEAVNFMPFGCFIGRQ